MSSWGRKSGHRTRAGDQGPPPRVRSVLPPRRAVCSTPLQGLAQALAARDGAGGQLPPAQAAGRPRGGRVGSCPQAPGGLEHTCDFNKEGSGMTLTESSGTRWSGEHPRTLAIVCVCGGEGWGRGQSRSGRKCPHSRISTSPRCGEAQVQRLKRTRKISGRRGRETQRPTKGPWRCGGNAGG